jgi:bifunctional non-homologous end joining protein LigD
VRRAPLGRRVPLRREQPEWIAPMLATLVEPRALPSGWIYEPKLDGVRCLAFVRRGGVRLLSRNRKPLDEAYPELAEAIAERARGDAVFDGEVVAMDPERGVSSFSLLQQRMQLRDARRARRSGVAIELWLFDCLFYEGIDLTNLPLEDRRRVLHDAVRFGGPVRLTPTLRGPFEAMHREACQRGAEGLIAKRLGSRYTGGRSGDWLKLKCVNRQELVIGGWTDPKGSREGLGALLVGYQDARGALRYAGKVGTGFDRRTLAWLAQLLARRAQDRSPFAAQGHPRERGVHWVTPDLVAEIGFSEWTPDGLLRHPRFLGLREYKAPADVQCERPAPRARPGDPDHRVIGLTAVPTQRRRPSKRSYHPSFGGQHHG